MRLYHSRCSASEIRDRILWESAFHNPDRDFFRACLVHNRLCGYSRRSPRHWLWLQASVLTRYEFAPAARKTHRQDICEAMWIRAALRTTSHGELLSDYP